MSKLKCSACGGQSVQILKLCWVDPNGIDLHPEVDWESEPESMGYEATTWCHACCDHTELVELEPEPRHDPDPPSVNEQAQRSYYDKYYGS
jgi:hypothetical protein